MEYEKYEKSALVYAGFKNAWALGLHRRVLITVHNVNQQFCVNCTRCATMRSYVIKCKYSAKEGALALFVTAAVSWYILLLVVYVGFYVGLYGDMFVYVGGLYVVFGFICVCGYICVCGFICLLALTHRQHAPPLLPEPNLLLSIPRIHPHPRLLIQTC